MNDPQSVNPLWVSPAQAQCLGVSVGAPAAPTGPGAQLSGEGAARRWARRYYLLQAQALRKGETGSYPYGYDPEDSRYYGGYNAARDREFHENYPDAIWVEPGFAVGAASPYSYEPGGYPYGYDESQSRFYGDYNASRDRRFHALNPKAHWDGPGFAVGAPSPYSYRPDGHPYGYDESQSRFYGDYNASRDRRFHQLNPKAHWDGPGWSTGADPRPDGRVRVSEIAGRPYGHPEGSRFYGTNTPPRRRIARAQLLEHARRSAGISVGEDITPEEAHHMREVLASHGYAMGAPLSDAQAHAMEQVLQRHGYSLGRCMAACGLPAPTTGFGVGADRTRAKPIHDRLAGQLQTHLRQRAAARSYDRAVAAGG